MQRGILFSIRQIHVWEERRGRRRGRREGRRKKNRKGFFVIFGGE